MLRPLWAALNPCVSAGPLLVTHQLHLSREAGSFFGQDLTLRPKSRRSEMGRERLWRRGHQASDLIH